MCFSVCRLPGLLGGEYRGGSARSSRDIHQEACGGTSGRQAAQQRRSPHPQDDNLCHGPRV